MSQAVAFRAACCAMVAVSVVATPLGAQERLSSGRQPVAVVCAAGVDRILDDIDYVFDSVGQTERAATIRGFVLNLNDLKGIDRTKPLGALLYLPEGGQGQPDVVGFVPVTRIGDLQVTLRISNQTSLEPGSDEGNYELRTPDNTIPVRLEGGYAFFAKERRLLEGPLPDVAALTAPLAGKYDVAVSLSRDGVPAAAVDQVLAALHQGTDKELDRKPNEGKAEFQLRTRLVRAVVEVAELVLADGRALTLGANLSSESRTAEVEALLTVAPRGRLAGMLQGSAASQSMFAAQFAEPQPLTISSAWTLSPDGGRIVTQVLELARREVGKQLKEDLESKTEHPVRRLLDALDATAHEGQVDSFLQLVGEPPAKFVLVGGAKVAQAEVIAKALEDILPHVRQSRDVKDLQMNAATLGGVKLHRIVGTTLRKQDRQLYGDDAAFYIGAGNGAIWIAVGGSDTTRVLEDVLTRTASPGGPPPSQPIPALQADLRLTSWLGMVGSEASEQARQFAAAARRAFSNPDADALRMQVIPGGEGLRLAVHLDEGYIRLLGLTLTEKMRKH